MEGKREVRRVAVTMENQLPHLFQLDQGKPLVAIINDLCIHYKLSNPQDYALQLSVPNQKSFITERNRVEIHDGTIMVLAFSPARMAQTILDQLDNGCETDHLVALKQLSELSIDGTFAQEFINRKGLVLIVGMIQSGLCSGETQAYLLKSFVELMDHGIVSWDDAIEPAFIKMVGNCVNAVKFADVTTLQSALEILESVVLHSTGKYALVELEVSPQNLIPHLQSSNVDVQKNGLALINALLLKAPLEKRKRLAESLYARSNRQPESIRNIILTCIIHKGSAHPDKSSTSPEMVHQLCVLQRLLFNLLDEKHNTAVDVNDQTIQTMIQDLRQIAFDTEPDTTPAMRRQSQLRDFKKLGFQNQMNPAEDFTQTPPGSLALFNMMYFAKIHGENYIKVVLENSCRGDNHDLPFARASIELTNILCDILKVGDLPSEEDQAYFQMFFTHDHAFEEFYCTCLQLLNKTWKEMRATSADFTKVFAVVKEQIVRALAFFPNTFDQFRQKLSHLTYSEITKLWMNDRRCKEENESQARPILELREQIKPEILELIKKQRLNHLVEGSRFTTKVVRRTDKFFYCRLSPNHKVFHYGECEENAVLTVEQLPNKLPVCNIKELLIGKDCPHIKDIKKKPNTSLAFTLMPEYSESSESLNFIATTEEVFNIWVDGISALLGKPMTSEAMKKDLETLLSMEIKLRLLDTEGIKIPEVAPLVPKEPPNYEFVFRNL